MYFKQIKLSLVGTFSGWYGKICIISISPGCSAPRLGAGVHPWGWCRVMAPRPDGGKQFHNLGLILIFSIKKLFKNLFLVSGCIQLWEDICRHLKPWLGCLKFSGCKNGGLRTEISARFNSGIFKLWSLRSHGNQYFYPLGSVPCEMEPSGNIFPPETCKGVGVGSEEK